uniref:Crustacean cardioactive peptide n=1 Tax=Carabus violaceus TaxID=41075 RepID=A0A7U3MC11_CARVO|nr:crustacean cardioactive peptide [Carabus violaceus]
MAAPSIALVFSTVALLVVLSHSFYLEKRAGSPDYYLKSRADPKKRPFCNAFTGCGRKRSNLPPLSRVMEQDTPDMENLGTLLDLSAEPAVEDLSRQIMSEAKLWEAIQEAHREIMRQRHQNSDGEEIPNANPLAGATSGVGIANGKCALPSCIAI